MWQSILMTTMTQSFTALELFSFFSVSSQKLALQTCETLVHGGIFRPQAREVRNTLQENDD